MSLKNIKDTAKKLEYQVLSKAVRPEDKPVSEAFKDKMMLAGLSAILGMAASAIVPLMPRLISRKPLRLSEIMTVKKLIGPGLVGGITGYTAPMLHNIILKQKRGELPKGQAEKEYKEDVYRYLRPEHYFRQVLD